MKFRRILEMLRVLSDLVRYGGFQDEVLKYLQGLYGYNPSDRAKNLMSVYERGYKERGCGDAAKVAANQAEFLEAIGDEIAWFEKREAAHLQARADLRPAAIEAELVSSQLELGKIMLFQDHLERAFEQKFKLLVSYRMMRADEGSETDKAIDVEAKSGERPVAQHADRPL